MIKKYLAIFILTMLTMGIFSFTALAASTYTYSSDEKTITASDGKKYVKQPNQGDGIDWDGNVVADLEGNGINENANLFKQTVWSGNDRYYIQQRGGTSQFSDGHLCHLHKSWWGYGQLERDCSLQIKIKRIAATTYEYKEPPARIVSSSNKTYTKKSDYLYQASDGSKIELKVEATGTTFWLIESGKTTPITVKNPPAFLGFTVARGVVYLKSKDPKNVIEKAIVGTIAAGFNITDTTDKNGKYEITPISAGTEYVIKVDYQKNPTTRVVGETKVTFNAAGKVVKGTADIIAAEVPITEVLDSVFEGLINDSIKFTLRALNKAIEIIMSLVAETVSASGEVAQLNSLNYVMMGIRNTALGLLTLGLLIIAFMNILGVDLNNYGINRLIPRMVIAVVLSYFSLIIAQALLEVSSALTVGLLSATKVDTSSITQVRDILGLFIKNLIGTITGQNGAQAIFIILLLLGLLLTCLWIAILLFIRRVVIIALVAVAPLAFIMWILPFTRSIFTMWWKRFLNWAFMGPAIAFFLYLGNEFLLKGYFNEKLGPVELNSSFIASELVGVEAWSFLILTAVCWGIAGFMPLIMGKEVYKAIQDNWKRHKDKIPGMRDATALLTKAQKGREAYRNAAINKRSSSVISGINKSNSKLGHMFTGKRGLFGENKEASELAMKEAVADLTPEQLQGRLRVLGGAKADLGSPEVIALLKKISKDIHTAAMDDETKQAVTNAFALSESLKEQQKTDPSVANPYAELSSNVMAGNPNKDAVTALYAHATENGYFDPTKSGMETLEKRAMGKLSGKAVSEHSEDDVKALKAGLRRDLDKAKEVHEDLQKILRDQASMTQYASKASTTTKRAHEKFFKEMEDEQAGVGGNNYSI